MSGASASTATMSDQHVGPPARSRPSSWSVVKSQTVYQLRTFTRSPVAMFFTLGLPLIMLILFNSIFGNQPMWTPEGEWNTSQFYTGGLAAFSAVSVLYTGIVNIMPARRDEGILKRWRGTPVPPWAFFAGWILSGVFLAAIAVALQLGVGVAFYGLRIESGKLAALTVTFLVGVATFAALGVAVAGLVPNAESAPAVANATLLPLAFISDVFIAISAPPRWLQLIGDFFPLKSFAVGMQRCLSPTIPAPGFDWSGLAQMMAWCVFGLVLARYTFKWSPARSAGRSRRGRKSRA